MRKSVLTAGLAALLLLPACKKKEPEPAVPTIDISGRIEIDPALAKKTQGTDTIFLIARPATGGPPLAVEKMTGNNYPYSFRLTDKNLMMQSQAVDVPLDLTVRVDKDGDAMTRSPGDLAGAYEKNPVSLRAENVVIRIAQAPR